jgi:isopentenyl diphosphate isomerase/L-lactate dehydrogenase-like FMN-dependent dehydrogenase
VGTLEVLPGIAAAVDRRVPLLIDSGIRRGCDVFKALALGADAVFLGRPYMWALTVGGEAGVRECLMNFSADLDLTCALAGKSRVSEISAADLIAAR